MYRKLLNSELNRPSNDEYKEMAKLPVVVVLDNVRSQHNIGSAFRTSDAFLVEKVVLCGICAVPPTPEIHKSALGAEFSVEWSYKEDSVEAVQELKRDGYTIIGVEQTENSTSLTDFALEPDKKYALVFGNEVKGVRQEVIDLCDMCVEIPQWGTKHSLNISVSVGVLLWETCKKLRSFLTALLFVLIGFTSCSDYNSSGRADLADRINYYDSVARSVDSISVLDERADYYQKRGNSIGEREYRLELGVRYRDHSRFMESIREHIKSLEISVSLKDTLGVIEMLNEVGNDYYLLGSMEEAASFYFMAMDYCDICSDTTSVRAQNALVRTLDNLGNIYLYIKRFEDAEQLFRQSLALSYDMGNDMGIAQNCINLTDVFLEYNQLDSARIYCSEASSHFRIEGSDIGLARSYRRYGIISDKENNHKEALSHYLLSYALFMDESDIYHAAEVSISLGDIYSRMGNKTLAIEYVNNAIRMAGNIHSTGLLRSAYYVRSSIYSSKGEYKAAYEDLHREEMYDSENDQIEFFMKRFDEVRRRNQSALHDRDVIIQQEISGKRKLIIAVVIIGLLFITVIVLMVKNHIAAKKVIKVLEETADLKSDFYARVTHEFRTPLSIITGQADMIARSNNDPKVNEMVTSISSQSRHLADVVNELLDIAKLGNSVVVPDFKRGDVNLLFKMTVDHFRAMAAEKMVHIEYATEVSSIEMDFVPYYMQKIALNLISNAIKFTPKGGDVYITTALKGGDVVITVADTGVGIDSKDLPYIFEPFYQGHTSQSDLGTGIGLTLIKQMTLAMGGGVQVFSIKGEGASFVLTIPRYTSLQNDVQKWIYEKPNELNKYTQKGPEVNLSDDKINLLDSHNKPLVLIVEDHREIAKYISDVLGDENSYMYADTGLLAINKAKEYVPDIIVTDLMMPEMDGYDFIKFVRNSDLLSHTPLIAVSALNSIDDKLKVLSLGADAFITKPFDPRELSVTVSNLILQRKEFQRKCCDMLARGSSDENGAEDYGQLSSVEMEFLVRLKQIVSANLQDPALNSDFISEKIFLSRSQVNRKVKSLTGMDTATFIRSNRMAVAKEMLLRTDLQVSDIAVKCGFEHQSYFNKLFKQEYGMTPSEMRRK